MVDAVYLRLRAVSEAIHATEVKTVGRLAAHTVRCDPAHVNGQDDQQDHRHRECNAARQRIDGAFRLALIDQHVVQTRAEIPEDHDEESDDQYELQRRVHGRRYRGFEASIIAIRTLGM